MKFARHQTEQSERVAANDAGALLALVATDPDRLDQPSQVVASSPTCVPNLGLWPWDYGVDYANRQLQVVDPIQLDGMAARNRQLLYELSNNVGHEGSDFQNPYAWAARGVLVAPSTRDPGLVAAYGVNAGETPADVALNVRATAGVLDVGGFG